MPWKSKRGRWNWRAFLTEDEAVTIRIADKQADQIEKMRRGWTERWGRKRSMIVNRAIQRAKYAASTHITGLHNAALDLPIL